MAHQLKETDGGGGEEGDGKFNFNKWIIQNGLESVKDAFFERNMCTLNTINIMDNNNFVGLMADYRILQNADLIPRIIAAVQSLEALRNKEDGTKLVYMTQNENEILREIHKYVENMDIFSDEFKSMNDEYENKKIDNNNKINKYWITCQSQLDDITDKIASHIGKLNEMVVKQDNILQNEINQYSEEINDIKLGEEKVVNGLDNILNNMHKIINREKEHFEDFIILYENTIKKYGNNYDTESQNERHSELEEIGNDAKQYYNTAINEINKYKAKITQFLNVKVVDDDEKDDVYSVNIKDKLYDHVWNDMNQFKIKKYDIDKEEKNEKNEEISWKQNLSFDCNSKYRWFSAQNNDEKKEENICNIQCVKILKEKPISIQLLNGKIIKNVYSHLLSTTPSTNNICQITNDFIKNIHFLFKETVIIKERFEFDFYCKKYCKVNENGTRCISLGAGIFGDYWYYFCCVSSTGWNSGVHQWSIQCNKCDCGFGRIGVVTNYEDATIVSKWMSELGSTVYYIGNGTIYINGDKLNDVDSVPSYSSGDIIRVQLNCEDWTVCFWKNDEFVVEVELKDKNKMYYPGIGIRTKKSGDGDYKLL